MKNSWVTKSQGLKVTKSACLCVMVALCLFLVPQLAQAATYYLDAVNGSDSNAGDSAHPWKTLAKALSVNRAGSTVKMATGDYGILYINNSYQTDYLTFAASDGATPRIRLLDVSFGAKANAYLRFEGINFQAEPGDDTEHCAYANGKRNIYLQFADYVYFKSCAIHNVGPGTSNAYDGDEWIPYDCAFMINSCNNVTLDNCTLVPDGIMDRPGKRGGISGSASTNINIINSTIDGNSVGITVKGSGYNITHNEIKNIWSAGINMNGSDVTIQDCDIHDIYLPPGAGFHNDGINIFGANITNFIFRRNIIRRSNAHAIMCNDWQGGTPPDNMLFENNLIYDNNMTVDPATAQTVAGISNPNYCWHMDDVNPPTNVKLINNTVIGCLRIHSLTFAQVTGNIIAYINPDSGASAPHWTTWDYNVVGCWAVAHDGVGSHDTTLHANEAWESTVSTSFLHGALFKNAANKDFTLGSSSIARDLVPLASSTTLDINGVTRSGTDYDAGCYEYGVESAVMYGDVDGNGEVSAYDAALTAQAAVGLITLTAEQIQAADVSGEGEVSAYDAALIAQKAVGLINRFPVES